MGDIAIKAERLGKLYQLGCKRGNYRTLRETLADAFAASVRGVKNPCFESREQNSNSIWALKDASFEIKRGEIIGIIGRNGAGKSTLLKILSRITEPTEGSVEIQGRIGSLLEVGTGFHAELTGRENIYLNGAILGMKKAEIKSRFDEIVAFAEVEKFIDTPVKHYSNGLYVRLAFAVAAHLEPEILLIDEVLAVGDTGFQRKCLGRMGTVAKDGRTVLFVSHQMNQIRRLCEKAIWLNSGRLQKIGMATEVVGSYESAMSSISLETSRGNHDEHVAARFLKWEIIESSTKQSNILDVAGPVTVEFTVKINRSIRNGRHGAALYNFENQLIWATVVSNLQLEPGICAFSFKLATLPVRPGVYYWYVSLYEENVLVDLWLSAPEMVVATKPAGHPSDGWQGLLNLPWKFTMRKE